MKKIKTLVSAVLVASMALALAACGGKVTEKTADEVKDACKKAGYDDDAIMAIDQEGTSAVMAGDDELVIMWVKSEDYAAEYEAAYDEMLEGVKNKDYFDGKYSDKKTDDYSYITFDGKDVTSDTTMYGGMYSAGDTFLTVMAMSDDAKSTAKDFIGALGYPKP